MRGSLAMRGGGGLRSRFSYMLHETQPAQFVTPHDINVIQQLLSLLPANFIVD